MEFAKENFDRGMDLVEAVMHAARQRLRPIIMTSLAFMSGVLPLAIASGAGSGAQHAVGTGVIGGMLAATFLADLLRAGVLRRDPALLQGEADDHEGGRDAGGHAVRESTHESA